MPVDWACIHIGSHKIYPLYRVPYEKNLWYCSVTFTCNPTQGNLQYSYSLQTSAYETKFPVYGKVSVLSTPASECKEQEKRPVKHQIQFDAFCSEDKESSKDKTIPWATIWYAKWFLTFVDDSSISPILIYIKYLNLPSVKKIHTKELVLWISELALQNSATDIQRFYLCIILSHFPYTSRYLIGKKACDRLLGCFSTCVGCKFLSKSDLERLKTTAIILVENSSSPGWLTLAAHFYPYLGIKFLLKNKNAEFPSHQYDSEKYKKLVTALFSYLKVDNQDHHKELLKYVMKSAATFVDAVELFQRSETSEIFATEDEKVDYFVKFVKKEYIKNRKKMSLWERLVVFRHMPQRIRGKVYKWLYSTLLEYAKSGDELKDVDIKVLVELILSIKQLGMDQFIDVLNAFSTSKSFSHQDLLLQILDDERFKEAWHEIPPDTTVDICKSWALNQVVTMKHKSKLDNSEMVVLVYQSMEAITQCCSLNTLMAQKVSAHVVERVFESKDAIYVLDVFESIEKLSPVVQECYISHVKKILTPELVKKSSQVLKKCSTTRYIYHFY